MDIWSPLMLSLQASGIALLLFLPLSVPLAWILATKNFPGRSILEVLIMAPLVLPPVVTGFLLLMLFSSNAPVGAALETIAGIRIPFTIVAAGLAGGLVAMPLMVRTIQQRFETMDHRLTGVARTLGAPPLDAFFSISLPQALPGVLAAALIGFARSFGEFGATVILAGNMPGKTQTIPSAIYSAINTPGGDNLVVLYSLLSIGVSVLAILATYLLTRRGGSSS